MQLNGSETSGELSEDVLKQVELREQIRLRILSGDVNEATDLLTTHFPSVLSSTDSSTTSPSPDSSAAIEYVTPTTLDPAHLSLNLRILAFTESCRTVPLDYPPDNTKSEDTLPHHSPDATLSAEDDPKTVELLSKAKKLYIAVHMLPKLEEREMYLQELSNVCGLLAYTDPENSYLAKYLSHERREAVADQINSAIKYRMGLPAISNLELATRYTSTLWSFLHDLDVKPRPDAMLPPSKGKVMPSSSNGADDGAPRAPPFDLHHFLDAKP